MEIKESDFLTSVNPGNPRMSMFLWFPSPNDSAFNIALNVRQKMRKMKLRFFPRPYVPKTGDKYHEPTLDYIKEPW